jgi:hypothetical protein
MEGKKFDQGKAPLHMIPEEAIEGMALAFGYGAQKYGEYNYRNGIDVTRLTDSLGRHTLAYLKGEDNDPESGLPHTYHILANAAMIEYMRVHKPEFDNRYKSLEQNKKANEHYLDTLLDQMVPESLPYPEDNFLKAAKKVMKEHKNLFKKLKEYEDAEKIITKTNSSES